MENNKDSSQYIWRTVQDDKVRGSHAAREGKTFLCSNPPKGGHPGKDFGCRCWAEAIKKKTSCEEKEIVWINANAKLFITKQNLEKEEKEKSQLEAQKSQKQDELLEINAQIAKEKKDKRDAQNKGAAIGGATGAIIGAPSGPGTSMGLGGIGIGIGAKGGRFFEEIGDAISNKSETDLSLSLKKQRLLKEIKELQKKIETLANKINTILILAVKKTQQEADKAKTDFLECKRNNKG